MMRSPPPARRSWFGGGRAGGGRAGGSHAAELARMRHDLTNIQRHLARAKAAAAARGRR